MNRKSRIFFPVAGFIVVLLSCKGYNTAPSEKQITIEPGANRCGLYIPLLQGKTAALVVNHTSLIGKTRLADTLLSAGVSIKKLFTPEHGYTGMEEAGHYIGDSSDNANILEIVSLYGDKKKPSAADLQGINIVVYDIQDVGTRFYTYISTLHYVMEACAENHIPLIVLDRPNPNGHYVDGPVLDTSLRSFVGLDPIPVVYGMTPGELAGMINGEGWLHNGLQCDLTVIPCTGYDHNTFYRLPVSPSPNLTGMESVYLYPSVCLFEGTVMSVGRGTDLPFRVTGHPDFGDKRFSFIPRQNEANTHPKFMDEVCYGIDLSNLKTDSLQAINKINLNLLIQVYKVMQTQGPFFSSFFDRLSGSKDLRKQITDGINENEIRESWQPQLDNFKLLRKKYLLYKDFD